MVKTLMRRKQVEAATGLPRSTLFALVAEGKFPKPVKLGPKSIAWLDEEVGAWIAARIAERDAKVAA
jgi:prophage regulatory protein